MTTEDRYESRFSLEDLRVLLDLGIEFGFDPSSSIELENFFATVLSSFTGSPVGLFDWLHPIVADSFRCLSYQPRWIQNPDWQVSKNGPMIFVGQVDAPVVEDLLHYESSFYVFFDAASGEKRTVMQIG